jgi:glycerol-3-phosphate dehydrogenase (NAD(P)+)
MMDGRPEISVIGAGSFGTAIAAVLANCGHEVMLYCRTAEQAQAIDQTGQNRAYFPGHKLPKLIRPTTDFKATVRSDLVFIAIPARAMMSVVEAAKAASDERSLFVNLVKGLHDQYFTFASLFGHLAPNVRYAALKGPTFARPLFLGEWSGFTCGTPNKQDADLIVNAFRGAPLHFDHAGSAESVDAISAIKNAYAIAIGIAVSLNLSENTIFMLLTRIWNEIHDVATEIDIEHDVLRSYCGIGDVLLTAFCDTSRNRTLGVMIGKGIPVDALRPDFLAEGVRTVSILLNKVSSGKARVLSQLSEILHRRSPPSSLLEFLQ